MNVKGKGVRLIPKTDSSKRKCCDFGVVEKAKDQSLGTVKGGDALCPYPDCGRVIEGTEIKAQAQLGKMGQQLYAVVYKQRQVTRENGESRKSNGSAGSVPQYQETTWNSRFRGLEAKMPEWQAEGISFPMSKFHRDRRPTSLADRACIGGPTCLVHASFGHCTSIEVFQDLAEELRQSGGGELCELDRAALTYVAIALEQDAQLQFADEHLDVEP